MRPFQPRRGVSKSCIRFGLIAALISGWAAAAAAGTQRAPNILVLMADDLGWNDVGYHGSEIRTPSIDSLASEGVRLERHYVYPTCSPTRAGLLTGRNPARFAIQGPIAGRSEEALPSDTATLAGLLRTRGYSTALAGKWHLGLRPEVGPRKYGFDRSYGYLHGQLDQYTHRYKNGDRTWHRNDSFIDEEGHATDLIAAEAVRILREPRHQPLFLWVAFSVPHHPVQEEQQWLAPYETSIGNPSRRAYAAAVSHMDAAVGRIIEALRDLGQLDDTLILFTSDNGAQENYESKTEYEGRHGPNPVLGSNLPLRGWKGGLYEGGIRVPAFLYWRGRLRPGVVRDQVNVVDWLPTFASLAGAQVTRQMKIDGRNVWPLMTGDPVHRGGSRFFWEIGSARGLLQDDWKLIVPSRAGAVLELYDLARDPAETRNLASEHPDKVKAMLEEIAAQKSR
jgi:arylsulfatase A-like enzyme